MVQIFSLFPFFRSSWSGDDWPNSQTPYWIMWQFGTQSFSRVIHEALYWNSQWVHGNGRFYPLAFIESRLFFCYFRTQLEYKILQIILLEFSVILAAYWIWKISKSHVAALTFIFCASFLLQGRTDFDPHVGFSMLLPSLLIKTFLASLLLIKASEAIPTWKKYFYSTLSGVTFLLGMCTYEYAFLLFPILLISLIPGATKSAKQVIRTIVHNYKILIIPTLSWIGYATFVFGYIRPRATAISGAYVLNLSWKSISTFLINLTAGFPTISFTSNLVETRARGILYDCLLGMVVLIIIFSFASGKTIIRKHVKKYEINSILILTGGLFIFAPSFMLAIQETWWSRISVGHSYLGVMIQEFGVGFLLSAFFARRNMFRDQIKQKISKQGP